MASALICGLCLSVTTKCMYIYCYRNDCKDVKPLPALSDADKSLIELSKSDPVKLVSESNAKLEEYRSWLGHIFGHYKSAGIQLWKHGHYAEYRCK